MLLPFGIYQLAVTGHFVLQQLCTVFIDQPWLLSHSTILLSNIMSDCNTLDFSGGILTDFYSELLFDNNGNSITHSLHIQRHWFQWKYCMYKKCRVSFRIDFLKWTDFSSQAFGEYKLIFDTDCTRAVTDQWTPLRRQAQAVLLQLWEEYVE